MMAASPPRSAIVESATWHAPEALFTDEKIFTVEANKNDQNDRIIAVDFQSAYKKAKCLNKTKTVHLLHVQKPLNNGAKPISLVSSMDGFESGFEPMDFAMWDIQPSKSPQRITQI
uniref:Uncharacterized protein n=1 Tax=Caenorhabditis japonica TaxID=281687 RepID=A0A8R1IS54_CAEJA